VLLHFDHIAIYACDIAASVRFYGELLGLPEAVNPMGGTFRWFALTAGVSLSLRPGCGRLIA
jgi:catechol 2,3-dioxygenase-like lactoylglutathione lyase family enzyme